LADEAFLRRIQTKVLVEDVTDEIFDLIVKQVITVHSVPAETGCAEYMRERCTALAPVRYGPAIRWTFSNW